VKIVLVCDDELMNRKLASKILNKEGFSVVEDKNGQEAIDVLQSTKIDVILMDLMMPVMDGYEATKIIKDDEKLSDIPLIVLSALSDTNSISKALACGADEYLAKPFNIIDFGARVKNALKNHSHE